MVLASGSMLLDWGMTYTERMSTAGDPLRPFANGDFIAAAVYVVSFAFIYITNRDNRYEPAIDAALVRPFGRMFATAVGVVLYNMFRTEIGNYFYFASVRSTGGRSITATGDLQIFNLVWQINYTLLFLIGMAAFNLRKFRSKTLAVVNCTLAVLTLATFATVSMFQFNELRMIFMESRFEPDFIAHWMYVGIRPIAYLLAGSLLYLLHEYTRDSLLQDLLDADILGYAFEGLAYTFGFIVASGELVNLMGQLRIGDSTKLGLSILWGGYALMMVVIGIAKDKKHLRIAAMALLGVTLAKLFLYDIADLETIPKTILFVTLGVTLLLVSFLYNKYKDVIFDRKASDDEAD